MTLNLSMDQINISLCCEPELYLRGSSCDANDSFPAEKITFPNIYGSNLSISSMIPNEFVLHSGMPCENNKIYRLNSDSVDNTLIHLLENGTIYINNSMNGGSDELFDADNYCLGSRLNGNGSEIVVSVCLGDLSESSAVLTIDAILSSLSLPFFAAIFIIYTILPELRNIHGYVFRSYVAFLFASYATYIAAVLIDPLCCYALILMLQFSSLASFFWMNVMSFDIWWTFGGFKSLQSAIKQNNRKKCIVYSCYAWGTSTLITVVGAIIDSVPSASMSLIRPGFTESCWFTTDTASMIYLYGPMAITMISNVFFFALTAIKIICHKNETARHLNGGNSQRHEDQDKERFNLYLKLFIVMGIPRMMELVVWLVEDIPDGVWYTIDLTNSLQGPIIFVIFVWNKKNKNLLYKRFGRQDLIHQSTNSTMPSSIRSRTSETCMETAGPGFSQKEDIPHSEHTETTTDESDGV